MSEAMIGPDPAAEAPRQATWDGLAAAARSCMACPELVTTRTQVVPGVAPPTGAVDLMLIGEAPGATEDETGVPFVGKSGQLVDTLLRDAGLARERLAVSNVVKCRPPKNRKPRRGEVERCRPWLQRQIELANPRVVVALGGTAAEWFAGPGARITDLRDRDLTYDGRPLLVTYHPSAAIRFGPNGPPLAALRADLARAADLLRQEGQP